MPFHNIDQRAVIKRNVLNYLRAKCFKRCSQHAGEIGGKAAPKPYEVGVSCFGVIFNEGRGHSRVDGEAMKESWIALTQHAISSFGSNEGVGQR